MLKPGLGKSLGDLMHGDQVAGKTNAPDPVDRPNLSFGRGMQTLVSPEKSLPSDQTAPKRPLLPSWFYFAADALLLAYTVAITFDAPRPFSFGTVLFCAISIGTGGILGLVGVLQAASHPGSVSKDRS
jgi:hypothetical protein